MPAIPTELDTRVICRTALSWTPDGELAREDRAGLLARLAAVDAPIRSWMLNRAWGWRRDLDQAKRV